MQLNELIKQLPKMSDAEVIKMLKHDKPTMRVGAIYEVNDRHLDNKEVEKALRELVADNTQFWNQYDVSDFAIAALDVLGIEKYRGERYTVRRLIESRFR